MQFLVKVSKVGNSRMIALPKMLANFCGFNRGDTLLITTAADKSAVIVGNAELNKRLATRSVDAVTEHQ